MTSASLTWLERGDDGVDAIAAMVDRFELEAGLRLHWVARHHLVHGSGREDDPFPRVEEHIGYLFGIVYVPSNPNDTIAEFDELVFVATHDRVIGSFKRSGNSVTTWSSLFDSVSSDAIFTDQEQAGGRGLVRMMKTVVKQLLADAEHFSAHLNRVADDSGIFSTGADFGNALDALEDISHRQRRELQSLASRNRDMVSRLRRQLPLMRRVIVETENILQRLANDEIDLKADVNGAERQLFNREMEIFVADIHVDARHVTSLVSDIDDGLNLLVDYMKQLRQEESVSASRFTGAIASIMLVPTFIVGLYGQNFETIPELSWAKGYWFSWAVIVLVTVGQLIFFRRRRWI